MRWRLGGGAGGSEVGGTEGNAEPDTPNHDRVELAEVDISWDLIVLRSNVALQVAEIDEIAAPAEVSRVGIGIRFREVDVQSLVRCRSRNLRNG